MDFDLVRSRLEPRPFGFQASRRFTLPMPPQPDQVRCPCTCLRYCREEDSVSGFWNRVEILQ